jgi:hypothetical protein
LDQLARVLAPGAPLIVTVPNYACFDNRVRIARGLEPLRADLAGLGGLHPSAFTVSSLRALLDHHGFVTDTVTGDVVMFRSDNARGAQVMASHRLARWLPGWSRNLIAVARRAVR